MYNIKYMERGKLKKINPNPRKYLILGLGCL